MKNCKAVTFSFIAVWAVITFIICIRLRFLKGRERDALGNLTEINTDTLEVGQDTAKQTHLNRDAQDGN